MFFLNTFDTSNYLNAGYSIFFGVAIIYLFSIYSRWHNLLRDLETLEELEDK